MKALRVDTGVQPPVVHAAEAGRPQPGSGELLIRVCAAGLMPTELSWSPTSYTKSGAPRIGAIPGHEFSGVVAGLGANAESFDMQAEVYGVNDWYSDGAMAEYCVAPATAVAGKPRTLSHAEAASVPISALTAWQALFDHADLKPGERVLIHGGAGSVGGFAIQLARLHGAHVTTTVSAQNRDFVLSLGAAQAIDYRAQRFEDYTKGMDVVFDTVGGETLERSWSVLKPGGRLVTVGSGAESSSDPRVQKAFFIMEPSRRQLEDIAAMLDTGKLHAELDAAIPLSEAADAYAGRVNRKGRGKLVVQISGPGV